jgi:ABC-type transport system substrate-binding protein
MKMKTPEKIDIEPVGTGPFVLKRYVKDNTIRYEAHPGYWAGRAKLDKVVFAITPDANVRFQKLKTGECHLVAEPSPHCSCMRHSAWRSIIAPVVSHSGFNAAEIFVFLVTARS